MAFDPLDPLGLFGGTDPLTYATGLLPQMIWGDFLFSLNTAAYQTLSRNTTWRHAEAERVHQPKAFMFLGPGDDTITLAGVIMPTYRGGTGQLDRMRKLGNRGKPESLIDGHGNVLGRWLLASVDEAQSNIVAMGIPRKQEFSLVLKHYDGEDYSLVLDALVGLIA